MNTNKASMSARAWSTLAYSLGGGCTGEIFVEPNLMMNQTATQREGSETVEVPKSWLKELIKLAKSADVEVYSNGLGNVRVEKAKLMYLKGYIGAAECLVEEQETKK